MCCRDDDVRCAMLWWDTCSVATSTARSLGILNLTKNKWRIRLKYLFVIEHIHSNKSLRTIKHHSRRTSIMLLRLLKGFLGDTIPGRPILATGGSELSYIQNLSCDLAIALRYVSFTGSAVPILWKCSGRCWVIWELLGNSEAWARVPSNPLKSSSNLSIILINCQMPFYWFD